MVVPNPLAWLFPVLLAESEYELLLHAVATRQLGTRLPCGNRLGVMQCVLVI